MLDAKIEGLDQLKKTLESLPFKLQRGALRSGVNAGAKSIALRARELAPRGDTKNLVKGIKWRGRRAKRGMTTITAMAVSTAPHAYLVEYGTQLRVSKKTGKESGVMPAHPHMRPALDEKWRESIDAVTMQVRKYLAKKGIR